MKIVLLEDLRGKGKAGEIKEVSKGYAKNFLLPRGLALVATPAVIKQVESKLEKERLQESVDHDKMVELAQQIEGKEIHLKARTGGGERLFGSVTAADVAEELNRSITTPVDKKRIDIERPFRRSGTYEVAVKLASDIRPQIKVVIEGEKEEEEQGEKQTEIEAEEKAKAEEDVEEGPKDAEEEKE
jgi:large subunit ribosomal protein L9